MDEGDQKVEDPAAIARDRRIARRVHQRSLLLAAVLTALAVLLPAP
jgi:hypothetical protein